MKLLKMQVLTGEGDRRVMYFNPRAILLAYDGAPAGAKLPFNHEGPLTALRCAEAEMYLVTAPVAEVIAAWTDAVKEDAV